MANLTLVYGSEGTAPCVYRGGRGGPPGVKLSPGRETQVAMHVLEGSPEGIEKRLPTSLEASFDPCSEI